jgi:hypothetical protein
MPRFDIGDRVQVSKTAPGVEADLLGLKGVVMGNHPRSSGSAADAELMYDVLFDDTVGTIAVPEDTLEPEYSPSP